MSQGCAGAAMATTKLLRVLFKVSNCVGDLRLLVDICFSSKRVYLCAFFTMYSYIRFIHEKFNSQ